ncbi:MAG: hypothetical protein AB7N91_20480 [Candidatus Tectimicrobiota bacterium]
MQPLAPVCFVSGRRRSHAPRPILHTLSDTVAEALSEAMQVLCCGEESAVLAFRGLMRQRRLPQAAIRCCQIIAREEIQHEALLRDLRGSLPSPRRDSGLIDAITHFYQSLAHQDMLRHLMQICALDSGACVIFAALCKAGKPLRNDAVVHRIFAAIHHDEARHTRASRAMVRELAAPGDYRTCMIETREKLAHLVLCRAAALETLHVDPDQLRRHLVHVPVALLS